LANARAEAVLDEIVLVARERVHARDDAMVVGEHEALGAYVRSRTAGQPCCAGHDPIKPSLIRRPTELALHARGGEIVEGPHAFLGLRRGRRSQTEDSKSGRSRAHILAHLAPK